MILVILVNLLLLILINWLLISNRVLFRSDINTLIANFINSASSSHHHFKILKSLLLILYYVLLLKKLMHFLICWTECISIYIINVAADRCHLLQWLEMPGLVLTLTEVIYCIVYFEWMLSYPFFIHFFFLYVYWFSHVYLGNIRLINYMLKFITNLILVLIEKVLVLLKLILRLSKDNLKRVLELLLIMRIFILMILVWRK